MAKKKIFLAFEFDALEDAEQAARLAGVNPDVIVAGLPRLWRDCWRRKSDRVRPEELGAFFTGGADERLRRALATKRFIEIDGSPDGDRVKGAARLLRISASKEKGGHAAKGNLKRGNQPGPGICREKEPDSPADPPADPRLLQPAASSQQPAKLPPNPPHSRGDEFEKEKPPRQPRRPRERHMHVVAPPAPTPPARDSPGWKRYELVLDQLRIQDAAYAVTQLEKLVPEIIDGVLVLHAADPFFGDHVSKLYLSLLRDAEAQLGGTGPPLELRFPLPRPEEARA